MKCDERKSWLEIYFVDGFMNKESKNKLIQHLNDKKFRNNVLIDEL